MKRFLSRTILVVAFILLGLYFIGSLYYKDRFPRNVYVNEVNIGGKNLIQADNEIGKSDLWNKVTIKSNIEDFLVIEADDIEYKYVSTPDLPEIFMKEKGGNWLSDFFNQSSYTADILSTYNKDKIKKMIDTIEEFDLKVMDANIVYSSDTGSFVIEPHSYEIKIEKEQLFDLIVQAIDKRDSEVNIDNYIEQPDIFQDNKALVAAKDKANDYLNMQIRYDFGDRKELIEPYVLKDFITFEGTEIIIDPEKVKTYVRELALKYDTFGKNRRFKTHKGQIITTNGGSYGWLIHRGQTVDALIEHIQNGENVTIEPIYSYKALIRDSNDIGNSYVEIDLKEQMVYVYINGQLKVASETVTGNVSKGNATPTGVFPINYKERNAILTGEDYASPVNYWMPFNKDIGLHDADWRDSFGENIFETDGSNGCVNLPPNNAKNIFDLVYPGMPVIVH